MKEAGEKIVYQYETENTDLDYVKYPELYELYLAAKRCLEQYW